MRLDGMDALIQHLEGAHAADGPVKQIVKRRTSEMNRLAQRAAPVDTGELRRSILSEYLNGGLTGHVTAGIHYAPYVEYGTRFMTAQPFMRPAFHAVAMGFREDLERLVR